MDVRVSRRQPFGASSREAHDVLAITVPQSEQLPRAYRALDEELDGRLALHIDSGTFKGKHGERIDLPGVEGGPARVMLVGLGKDKEISAERVRSAVGGALKAITARRDTSVVLAVPGLRRLSAGDLGQAATEGAILGGYRFDKYRTMGKPTPGVSKLHCTFTRDASGTVSVTDAGSRNGTEVNGRMLTPGQRLELAHGDTLRICSSVLLFTNPSAEKVETLIAIDFSRAKEEARAAVTAMKHLGRRKH